MHELPFVHDVHLLKQTCKDGIPSGKKSTHLADRARCSGESGGQIVWTEENKVVHFAAADRVAHRMRIGSDPKMALRIGHQRLQLGVRDLVSFEDYPVSEVPCWQRLIRLPQHALPTFRPEPIGTDDQVAFDFWPRFKD